MREEDLPLGPDHGTLVIGKAEIEVDGGLVLDVVVVRADAVDLPHILKRASNADHLNVAAGSGEAALDGSGVGARGGNARGLVADGRGRARAGGKAGDESSDGSGELHLDG